jgi:hypothetical protein
MGDNSGGHWSEHMRALALICILVVAVPSISQNEHTRINGVVLRPDGRPLEGAFVIVRDFQQTGQGYISDTWQARTATGGSFSFAAPRGCYDIFVSGNTQFLPFAQRRCVQPEGAVLKIKLKADPHPVLLVH